MIQIAITANFTGRMTGHSQQHIIPMNAFAII